MANRRRRNGKFRAERIAVIWRPDRQPKSPEVGETVGHCRAAKTNIRSSRCGFCRSSFRHPFMFAADLGFQSCQRYGAACAGQRCISGALISLDPLLRIHLTGKLSRQMEGSDAAWPIFRESDPKASCASVRLGQRPRQEGDDISQPNCSYANHGDLRSQVRALPPTD